ncbi:FtsX-like permease family protein [Ginsengibacter hankyongi]|uniref:FtsX-like permease family protein n=1 Tax=Ginsengibacter hankyongi TaxID=2607284 RepID=A0A5J5IAH2_9BACT|nr:ABC transporter permease [Ginsengibacter hankyongi]KAA9035511.1 FtsX-like permease family protein [Ginsengibacter hankyongi]
MFKTYLKTAWRNVLKSKLFSIINVIGLSVGLTCCMLITLYIINETSYDSYQKNAANIYQLGTEFVGLGNFKKLPNTPAPMAEMMKANFPEIKQTTRVTALYGEDKTLLQYQQRPGEPMKSFYETKGLLADSTFFRMFTYNFIEGDPQTALNNPNTVVLSDDIANKLFGNEPALNKVIHISSSTNGDHDFLVTGVFKPIDKPSHVDGRFFMSMMGGKIADMIKDAGTNLVNNNIYFTYLQLDPNANVKRLESEFPAFIDKYAGKGLKDYGFGKKQFLVPLTKIHLDEDVKDNLTPGGSVTYLYILASIALFTLLIACINFMNLATAQSAKRSAEVGIRKVLGAERKFLITQFLGEAVLMSVFALLLAFAFTKMLLPLFNSVSGRQLSFEAGDNVLLIATFVALSVITGLIAGSYPAFYLSSFNPAKVLKGKFANSLAAVSLRKGLVVFQFVISIVLIIASVVIASQMKYLRSADLGFTKDQQIVIPLRSENAKKIYGSFKNDLLKQAGIANVGASMFYPGISNVSDNILYTDGKDMQQGKDIKMNYIDTRYLQSLNIKPLAGRLYSDSYFTEDTTGTMVINETAAKSFGFKDASQAVNQKLHTTYNGVTSNFNIIGVVKDFHYEDLHLPIGPYGFQLNTASLFNYMIVHIQSGDMNAALQSIGNTWHQLNATEPFDYSFLDKDFQKNYDAENRLAAIVGDFTIIAILISCLGLFGLATFSAEQRIKEIGVRKVLGASVTGIVTLLSKDFLKLVGIAIIIASPLAWFLMNKWLQSFAYRTPISWWVFVITAFIAMFIALVTISFQAIKAAVANPVKSLRTE